MNKKIKVLTLSDHPLSPSGVGTQTKYMIQALLSTDKFKFVSMGGAIKHKNYQPMKLEEYGDDWVVHPVDGYGNPDVLRSMIRNERPDILWFMTDPRFWGWLWQMEDEIRPLMPTVYYHVWDNYPYPGYNKKYYDANDVVATISKLTDDVVRNLSDVECIHIPHAVDTEVFKKVPDENVREFRTKSFQNEANPERMIFFWNNRNARRKQSGSLIFWFKEFLDRIGHENACLIMHTDPKDNHGQDLEAIVHELGLTEGQVLFSTEKIPADALSMLYNVADCTINISDAEGFGLATLESLACETPIIVNMTGGLQEQVTDGEEWFGIGLQPSSRSIIGSQDIPWIYEDRINGPEFVDSLEKFYNTSKEARAEMGAKGRSHVMKNYNFDNFNNKWIEVMTDIHEKHGSWDTRRNYKSWRFEEL